MAFYHPVIDPPGEAIFHGIFVFLYPSGKRLEFGKFATCYLVQPGVEALTPAVVQHLHELLDQVIGQIDLWVKLAKLGYCFLLLDTEFFQATKKEENSLS